MNQCPTCGGTVLEGDLCCTGCGHQLYKQSQPEAHWTPGAYCSCCGQELDRKARPIGAYCPRCGNELEAKSAKGQDRREKEEKPARPSVPLKKRPALYLATHGVIPVMIVGLIFEVVDLLYFIASDYRSSSLALRLLRMFEGSWGSFVPVSSWDGPFVVSLACIAVLLFIRKKLMVRSGLGIWLYWIFAILSTANSFFVFLMMITETGHAMEVPLAIIHLILSALALLSALWLKKTRPFDPVQKGASK